MQKKLSALFLSLILLLVLLIGFSAINLQSAVCTPKDGTSCEGECCKLTKDGCIAGPCSVILK